MTEIPVLILAAGVARRMRGIDKLLEPVDGVALIRRQALVARAATRAPVLVALPPAPHPRYGALEGVDITPVPVADAAYGMSASLKTGLTALPADAPAVLLFLADLPELEVTDLVRVLKARKEMSDMLVWRGATEVGEPGHPIVVDRSLFTAFDTLSGDAGGQAAIDTAGERIALVPLPGRRARLDLDTPEDWAEWRRMTGR